MSDKKRSGTNLAKRLLEESKGNVQELDSKIQIKISSEQKENLNKLCSKVGKTQQELAYLALIESGILEPIEE